MATFLSRKCIDEANSQQITCKTINEVVIAFILISSLMDTLVHWTGK